MILPFLARSGSPLLHFLPDGIIESPLISLKTSPFLVGVDLIRGIIGEGAGSRFF